VHDAPPDPPGPSEARDLPDLVRHVCATTGLPPGAAARVVADVLTYLDEDVETFVRRRHAELRRRGLVNMQIWTRLAHETGVRRFAAPVLSERQLRRIVYG
jgi:hypothetical protein